MARESKPDLIFILGTWIPDINGLELSRKLKDDPIMKDIPIVLASSYCLPHDIVKNCGADYFLQKPFILSTLRKKIEDALAGIKSYPPITQSQNNDGPWNFLITSTPQQKQDDVGIEEKSLESEPESANNHEYDKIIDECKRIRRQQIMQRSPPT